MSAETKRYIAVVDDDASIARAFARLLRSVGYEPITYASAEAFLDDTRRPRFECLVLDFQLEGISGPELCRRLGAVNDSTPVLLITARDEPEDRAAAESCGCAGYFHKTELGAVILEEIEKVIRKTHTEAASPLTN